MELTLRCMVPVYVVMQGDSVVKVVVDDENLQLGNATLVEPVSEIQAVNTRRLNKAIRAADESTDWPAWEFGW